jgi:hypothetical protein
VIDCAVRKAFDPITGASSPVQNIAHWIPVTDEMLEEFAARANPPARPASQSGVDIRSPSGYA